MNSYLLRIVASVGFTVGLGATVQWAQGQDGQASGPPPIAAVVNGQAVYVAALEAKYHEVTQQRSMNPKLVVRAKAELLTQLINQIMVAQALERDENLVTQEEIDRQQDQVAAQVKKEHGVTLEQFAQMNGFTVDSVRGELFWQIAWNRYLERHLADALEGYFDRHKKDLDGTEVRVSHILLRAERYNETNAQIVARANKIRQAIESGSITFEDAAAKHSAGPSRIKGGDLGFIPRNGVMIPEFASAAFQLKEGEISEPVTTAFGTHLIRLTSIKPGTRQWTEVIPQIKVLASAEMFEELAERESRNAKIEFTGVVPYIQQGTNQLVLPPSAEGAATK